MALRSLRIFLCVLSLCLAAFWLVALDSPVSAAASIQRLEIEQTSSGPIIHGVFRSSLPDPPGQMCGMPHCVFPLNNPQPCENHTKPTVVVCHPDCNSVELDFSVKPLCNCLCDQTTPAACVGCKTDGYCGP